MAADHTPIHLGQGTFRERSVPLALMGALLGCMILVNYATGHGLPQAAGSLACIPLVVAWFWALEAYANRGHVDRDASVIHAVICAGAVAWLVYGAFR